MKMVYYVNVAGVDGSGKSTAFKQVSEILSRDYGFTVVQVRRSAWVDRPGQNRQPYGSLINDFFDSLHIWADRRELRTFAGLVNLAYAPVSRGMKEYATHIFKPDFMLSYRDTVLDPLTYCAFYFPFTQQMSLEARAQFLRLFGNERKSDLTFYMEISPRQAFERILRRIASETKLSQGEIETIDRRKFHHMHETPDNLEFLIAQFERVIPFAQRQLGLDVVRIDATQPKDDVIDLMIRHICDKFHIEPVNHEVNSVDLVAV